MAAMAYAGALPFLRQAWDMDATTAGGVQAVYNFSNALALLVASWLSDRVGAKKVYLVSVWCGVVSSACFALFARSHASAVILAAFLAMSQGGAYTPALMLVAEMVPSPRRGGAMGGMLAAGSFGYVLSVLGALGGSALLDYRWGFAICAIGPLVGAIAGTISLKGWANVVHPKGKGEGGRLLASLVTPVSLLLTLGYTAHCWELLGSWAWMPSFLANSLALLGLGPVLTGLVVACSVHLAGTIATLTVGHASDRWGRPAVLLCVAAAGAGLTLSLGWSAQLGPLVAVGLAFAASFFILGDSGVLSAAMTEAVPAKYLGTVLALRSILGFGAGSLSPVAFGMVLDATGQWGWAFVVLGCGGMMAAVAAAFLPRRV
jgi:MFS family permease